MSLSEWARNGWLTKHRTSRNEIHDLLQVVERDLADSAAENVSADWRMNIAYNAGLQAATAALAAAGYRATRDAHHYRVIYSLRETLRALRSPEASDRIEPGRDLNGVLRPYQQTGVRWLHLLSQLGLGACLADDMGLGKTIQVLALLLMHRRERDQFDNLMSRAAACPWRDSIAGATGSNAQIGSEISRRT
ncbi:MAG: putative helicase [Acidobacteria bacterium]|nr:putative helicase [Acidobacteriota bacterium]